MISIIVAFPKLENARSIKSILVKGGYEVGAVCTSGSHVLQAANELGGGILVCGGRLTDMEYQELNQYLPSHFEMLLLAPPQVFGGGSRPDIICLPMPFKVHDLLQTVEMMVHNRMQKRRKEKNRPRQRTKEEQVLIDKAKALLQERNNMTEEEAHRYIQKSSMDMGMSLGDTAQMVLSHMEG